MFQKINDIINTSYETVIPRGKEELIGVFVTNKSDPKWFSFLIPSQIDLREIKINGDMIEILRMPGTFSPFRTHGKIRLHLLRAEKKDQTKIRCEIFPGNNTTPYLIFYQILTTGLLAILFLIMGKDFPTKVIGALVVVIIPGLISYLKHRSSRRDLIDYSRVIIKMMRD
jgi:hypothetical protein